MTSMLTMMTLTLALASGQQFVSIGVKQGVEVFERKDSPAIELAAEGEIDASPEEVQAVLLDYPAAPQLIHRLAESRVLSRGAREVLVYQRLKLPVVSDRDYVVRTTWGTVGAARTIRYSLVSAPTSPGVTRMALLEGSWDLQPSRGGRATRARYQFRIDFGGSVPRWMVRGGAAKDLPSLYAGILRMATMRRASAMVARPRVGAAPSVPPVPNVQQARW